MNEKEKDTYRKFLSLRKTSANDILNESDLVIAPSQYIADKFKSFGYHKTIKVISLGINYIQQTSTQTRDKLVFGFAGAINKLKNIDLLIKSFSAVKGSIQLNIYGNGEENFINDFKSKILKEIKEFLIMALINR